MGVSEVRRLKQFEEENKKLKQLVADLYLDKTMLQDVIKKMVRPVKRRIARPVRLQAHLSVAESVRLAREPHAHISAISEEGLGI